MTKEKEERQRLRRMYRKVAGVSFLEDMVLRRSLGRRGRGQPVGRREKNRLAAFRGEDARLRVAYGGGDGRAVGKWPGGEPG